MADVVKYTEILLILEVVQGMFSSIYTSIAQLE